MRQDQFSVLFMFRAGCFSLKHHCMLSFSLPLNYLWDSKIRSRVSKPGQLSNVISNVGLQDWNPTVVLLVSSFIKETGLNRMSPDVVEDHRVMVTHLPLGLSPEGTRTLVPSSLCEWECMRRPCYLGIKDRTDRNSHCPVEVYPERL